MLTVGIQHGQSGTFIPTNSPIKGLLRLHTMIWGYLPRKLKLQLKFKLKSMLQAAWLVAKLTEVELALVDRLLVASTGV